MNGDPKQINYVFSCNDELKQLRELCTSITNHDDYPYAKIVGLIVSTMGNIDFINNDNVRNYVLKYLTDVDKYLHIDIKQNIADKAMSLYVLMYTELTSLSLIGFKTMFVITVDPYVVAGIVF